MKRTICTLLVATGACAHAERPASAPLAATTVSPPVQDAVTSAEDIQLRAAVTVVNEVFRHLDCELDDVVDEGEVVEHNSQVFRRFDLDRSISLSPPEYQAIHVKMPSTSEEGFRDADRNGDGSISVEEFRQHLSEVINRVDVNTDGQVSLSEVEELKTRLAHDDN